MRLVGDGADREGVRRASSLKNRPVTNMLVFHKPFTAVVVIGSPQGKYEPEARAKHDVLKR